MIDFLLTSTISLTVLLTVYKLWLENEKMHLFNRFYLLSGLVFSYILPFITIPVSKKTMPVTNIIPQVFEKPPVTITSTVNQPDYIFYIVLAVYIVVSAVFAIRFTNNIYTLYRKIALGTILNHQNAKLILLSEDTFPHTFLNFIFLNKGDYNSKKIEEELYKHEMAHVQQRHTLDILFIEILKIFFWFNPLLYLYKNAIRLNHEFLADEVVVKATQDTLHYQNLLLSKAGSSTTPALTSTLNFSITKKRFTMMTKSTSKTRATILQALVLPVATGLIILCCTETIAQESKPKIDFERVSKIEVLTPTQTEIDSLRNAEPAKFKDEPDTQILRTNYTLNEKGTEKVITVYDKSKDYKPELSKDTRNGLAGIDPSKINSIKVNSITEAEMDSLIAADSKRYKGAKAEDFRSITVIYLDSDEKLAERTYYERVIK